MTSGGYTSASWSSERGYTLDYEAFVFSLDYRTVYKPTDYSKALYQGPNIGPVFGGYAFGLWDSDMNSLYSGRSITNGYGGNNYFDIPTDIEGNSILTGDGELTKLIRYLIINLVHKQ